MLHKFLLLLLVLIASVPTYLSVSEELTATAVSETAVWQPTSTPTGGSIAAVAISPDIVQDQTAYAAVRGRGVYRSKNGGFDWQPASPDGWYVNDLVLSPDFPNDQTLFVTTGLPTTNTTVQRSSNRGLTWQPATFANPVINGRSLTISPNFATDQTLYLVTNDYVHVSTNGGANFAAAPGWFSTHTVDSLALATDQIMFAAAADAADEGIFRSENGGANWTLLRSGTFTAVAASPHYTTDHIVLALDITGQLHRSDNGGASWTTPSLTVSSGGKDTIAFSPTFASDNVVMAASSMDNGPYISKDGGLTWIASDWYDPADTFNNGLIGGAVLDLALAPNQDWSGIVLAATNVGIARSSYGGDLWRQANDGLPDLTVQALAAAPGMPVALLAGTAYFENIVSMSNPGEYDGNLQLSTDGGYTWRVVSERLQQVTAVTFSPDFANDQTALAATGTIGQHGFYDGGVYRSTDGGEIWEEVLSHLVITDLAVSPSFAADKTVWAAAWSYSGSQGVYRSTNGGDSWLPIAPGIAANELAVSPNFASDQTILATTSGGLQKSTNGGASWNPVGPAEEITAVTLSPFYGASQTILMTTIDALHRSTDGGIKWQTLDIGLPAIKDGKPLRLNFVSFGVDGSLLVTGYYDDLAASAVVRRSSDAGATWQTVGTELAADLVRELFTQPTNSFLITAVTNTGLQQITIEQGTAVEPGSWNSSGPRGGEADTLVVSPDFANDGIAFGGEWMADFQAGAIGLGPHKSSDFGQTWQAKPSDVSYSNPVLDYAFSPEFASDNTVFAATWGDILKSTDEGETWQPTGAMQGFVPGFFSQVAAAPDYPISGLVLAGADYYGAGLYVSRDGGTTWEDPQPVSAGQGIAFSPDFANDQTIFAAGFTGVSQSVDTAVTWTPVLTTAVHSFAISPNFASDQTLFAGETSSPGSSAYFYRSTDGGSSWVTRTIAANVSTINALAPSPAYASDQTLFAGTNAGLFWSNDGGDSWMLVTGYANDNILSLAISPEWPAHAVLLVGLEEGVFRLLSSNPVTGIVRQPSEHFTALPTNPLALAQTGLLLTASANHSVYASEDGGASWHSLGLGGGYYSFTEVAASPAYASDETLFAAKVRSDSIGSTLYRSQNGGQSWSGVFNADTVSDIVFSPDFAADDTVFAASNEKALHVSTDGGDSWSDKGTWPVSKSGVALQVALPPNYPTDETIFAGGAKGFWRLLPGETMWQTPVSGLTESHRILSIAVSPAYVSDQTLLALASWSNLPDYTQHYGVFRSSDGGANWSQVGSGLPDEWLFGLALSPTLASDGLAYVTTRAGDLYRSRDRGTSWTLAGSAPGHPYFTDVVVAANGAVFAASEAGIWRYVTPQFDIIINGGFEAEAVWDLPITPRPAQIANTVVYDGKQAVQIGSFGGTNVYAYSSARQDVAIPAGTQTAALSFYAYAVSGDQAMAVEMAVFPDNSSAITTQSSEAPDGDAQYVLILDPDSNEILETLLWERSNGQLWQPHNYDLSAYAGQTIRLHFGVYNDGKNGRTGLVVDNVSLLVDAEINWPYAVYLPVVVKP